MDRLILFKFLFGIPDPNNEENAAPKFQPKTQRNQGVRAGETAEGRSKGQGVPRRHW